MWVVLLLILVGIFIYYKFIKPINYWKEKGIPHQKPTPIIGNMLDSVLKKKPFVEIVWDIYKAFPNERYFGMHQFSTPVLVIRDLDLIKQITVKDFDHFMDHNPVFTEDLDPLMGKNLFSLRGQRWRDMRATLSPSFTGSKMRMMHTLLQECAEQFTEYFEKQETEVITVEMKDIFTRFTNDAIASVAFGLKVDSLKERDNTFYVMGKEATNFSGFLRTLKFVIFNSSPRLCKLLNIQFFPPSVSTFFRTVVKETIKQREKEGLIRPDMINLLMEARKGHLKNDESSDKNISAGFATIDESDVGKVERHHKLELTDEDITAQALIFFFGGFETSATLMSFIAYELAVNPDIQDKLQAEIDETLEQHKGKITYEALLGMKYLDMVISETLRKWPPGFQLDRVCVKEFTIQPGKPGEKPFTIEKDQIVFVPVIGIHRDPRYFPNPDKFDPERFNEENKHTIEPASYMPFGAGPRSCIASRFALMENKILICQLLSRFDIVPVKETIIPLKLGVKTFNFMPDGGFWLGLRRRKAVIGS